MKKDRQTKSSLGLPNVEEPKTKKTPSPYYENISNAEGSQSHELILKRNRSEEARLLHESLNKRSLSDPSEITFTEDALADFASEDLSNL